jgi:hypothetical protein
MQRAKQIENAILMSVPSTINIWRVDGADGSHIYSLKTDRPLAASELACIKRSASLPCNEYLDWNPL